MTDFRTKLFRIMCAASVYGFITSQTIDDANGLFWSIFGSGHYVKYVRPAPNQTDAVEVETSFVLNSIIDFNEQQGSLTTSGYLSLSWLDPGLKWNSWEFGETRTIFVPQDMVWKPDVTLSNSFTHMQGLGYDQLNVVIADNGYVSWNPPQVLTSTCSVDVTYFPFDTQTCWMKFTAWSYREYEVRMTMLFTRMIRLYKDYTPNSLWTLVDSSSREDSLDASVTFTLKLERKSSFYVMNIIVPVIMLTILAAFTFVLPVQSGERASFAVTVFLALAVFLTIVASEFPKNSEVTPLLGVYLLLMISISTLISIISVVQIRLIARDDGNNSPDINAFCRCLHKVAMVLLCRKCVKAMTNNKARVHAIEKSQASIKHAVDEEQKRKTESLTWSDVIFASDVLLFLLSLSIIAIATLVFFTLAVFNPQRTENKYADGVAYAFKK